MSNPVLLLQLRVWTFITKTITVTTVRANTNTSTNRNGFKRLHRIRNVPPETCFREQDTHDLLLGAWGGEASIEWDFVGKHNVWTLRKLFDSGVRCEDHFAEGKCGMEKDFLGEGFGQYSSADHYIFLRNWPLCHPVQVFLQKEEFLSALFINWNNDNDRILNINKTASIWTIGINT